MRSIQESYSKGYTYVITRRIIQRKTETVLRVRVRAYEGLTARGEEALNEFRDYRDLHQGDAAYERITKQIRER